MLGFGLSFAHALGTQNVLQQPFDPLNLGEMSEWFDFRTLTGSADGDPVSSWVGRRGLYTLAQTGTARPTWKADDGDGSASISMDGVDDSLGTGINNELLFGTTGDMEIWLVIKLPPVPAAGVFTSTGISNQIGLNTGAENATLSLCHGSVSITFPTALLADNGWHVLRLMKSGARRAVAIDGSTVYDSTTSAGPYVTGDDALNLGYYFGSYGVVGFRHWLAFTEPLSDAVSAALTSYLGDAK